MTTRDKVKLMLKDRGMSDLQAEEVMEVSIAEIDKSADCYKITWDRPAAEYEENMYRVFFVLIKPIALKWIDENIPRAWYRSMFI